MRPTRLSPLALRGVFEHRSRIGRLVEGKWTTHDAVPTDKSGRFLRGETTFRDRVTADGASGFGPEAGRYHLYVSYACPWAHRTLIARSMLGLEDAVGVSVSHPIMGDDGWVFEAADVKCLWQVYAAARRDYSGRVTVPVLWDTKSKSIVNNESREILRMFATQFGEVARAKIELSPPALRESIDSVISDIYNPINNGVYRAGFARTQQAHEEAIAELFAALDKYEAILGDQRYVCGDAITEADICLFTTLFRFDIVYVTHFKCNVRRIVDYPNLWGYVRDVYQTPGVAKTCFVEYTKTHYFGSHLSINPRGLVPLGPDIDFTTPHGRA